VAEKIRCQGLAGRVGVKADGNGKGGVAIVSTVFGVREMSWGIFFGEVGLCQRNDDGVKFVFGDSY
jgi:hypothetical protein